MRLRWMQAANGPVFAVQILHAAAVSADQVVMGALDTQFVQRGTTSGLDAMNESRRDEVGEHVVNALSGHSPGAFTRGSGDLIGGHVAVVGQDLHHGYPRGGHTESMRAQRLLNGHHNWRVSDF